MEGSTIKLGSLRRNFVLLARQSSRSDSGFGILRVPYILLPLLRATVEARFGKVLWDPPLERTRGFKNLISKRYDLEPAARDRVTSKLLLHSQYGPVEVPVVTQDTPCCAVHKWYGHPSFHGTCLQGISQQQFEAFLNGERIQHKGKTIQRQGSRLLTLTEGAPLRSQASPPPVESVPSRGDTTGATDVGHPEAAMDVTERGEVSKAALPEVEMQAVERLARSAASQTQVIEKGPVRRLDVTRVERQDRSCPYGRDGAMQRTPPVQGASKPSASVTQLAQVGHRLKDVDAAVSDPFVVFPLVLSWTDSDLKLLTLFQSEDRLAIPFVAFKHDPVIQQVDQEVLKWMGSSYRLRHWPKIPWIKLPKTLADGVERSVVFVLYEAQACGQVSVPLPNMRWIPLALLSTPDGAIARTVRLQGIWSVEILHELSVQFPPDLGLFSTAFAGLSTQPWLDVLVPLLGLNVAWFSSLIFGTSNLGTGSLWSSCVCPFGDFDMLIGTYIA
ncbi:hypothetical protein CBR_g309 [Chara braunii]|uniref:Uncharacterized protein n=1 Tax=Chara braunii TaxID=69332 RepID=A0A388JQD4_CHABU|nr:hypothetical protein CBR_g309 [Chara braunii]|eukprot:GBG59978.1 hypothetical protein CBR_g309 [Chara braunii]